MADHEDALPNPGPWLRWALPLLACVGGSVDAMAYLALGRVFPANMTGNTVLLVVALVSGDAAALGRGGVVLAGFLLGVAAAAWSLRRTPRGVSARVGWLLGIEALILAGLGTVMIRVITASGNVPMMHLLGGMAALAMGMQSAVVRHLDVGNLRSTFITGPLVDMVAECLDPRPHALGMTQAMQRRLHVGIYGGYAISALLAAWVCTFSPPAALVAPLLVLLVLLWLRVRHAGP